jgi:hypothetical protein
MAKGVFLIGLELLSSRQTLVIWKQFCIKQKTSAIDTLSTQISNLDLDLVHPHLFDNKGRFIKKRKIGSDGDWVIYLWYCSILWVWNNRLNKSWQKRWWTWLNDFWLSLFLSLFVTRCSFRYSFSSLLLSFDLFTKRWRWLNR